MALYEVNKVVGAGTKEILVCQTIPLPTPVEEIKQILKTVIIDNCKVIFDKVIIDGRLRKNILFKQAGTGFPPPGVVQTCSGVTTTVAGTMMDLDIDIAFNTFVHVPHAKPDDTCVVLQAFVEGEKEEAAAITTAGTFGTLINKSVIRICVKVIRDTLTGHVDCGPMEHDPDHEDGREYPPKDLLEGHFSLCPPARSTGMPIGGGSISAPKPGPFPGTWVGPTLLFAGVANPGIPTTVPPSGFTTIPPGGEGVIGTGVIVT